MTADIVIRAEGLGKKYVIGHQAERERYTALRDVIGRTARNFVRTTGYMLRGRPLVTGDSTEEFWALKDLDFEVSRGEVLGIIGRNGAGKSTLLKILSRVTEPTEGRVEIRGRVASLLEVGTGFHPELTGRENIYLNGAILGMSRAEIRRKFDEIVAFAEVEKFLDTPVKRYSSGMYVRLGFAVAAHLEPEILVVDEVLAVGDAEFQKKCLGKMGEVASGGRTVLFVSHNMAAVERLCRSCIALDRGAIFRSGLTSEVLQAYLASAHPVRGVVDLSQISQREGRGYVRFSRIMLLNGEGHEVAYGRVGQSLEIRLFFSGTDAVRMPSRVGVSFANAWGGQLFTCETETTCIESPRLARCDAIRCIIPQLPLSAGLYKLTLFLERAGTIEDFIVEQLELRVEDGDFFGTGRNTPRGWEGRVALIKHSWTPCNEPETDAEQESLHCIV